MELKLFLTSQLTMTNIPWLLNLETYPRSKMFSRSSQVECFEVKRVCRSKWAIMKTIRATGCQQQRHSRLPQVKQLRMFQLLSFVQWWVPKRPQWVMQLLWIEKLLNLPGIWATAKVNVWVMMLQSTPELQIWYDPRGIIILIIKREANLL